MENVEGKDQYLTRKILKQMDELGAIQKIHKKELGKKGTWKEMKKVSRYFKSSLYAIKTLDRGSELPYNTDSPEGEILNNSEE